MKPQHSALIAALVGLAQTEADEDKVRGLPTMEFRVMPRPDPGPVIYHERGRRISGVPDGFSRAKRRAKNKEARKARAKNRRK